MEKQKIEEILKKASDRFLESDSYLLSVDANERALTHKFAEHLQLIIGDEWSVDCEYNRAGTNPKTIYSIKNIVGENVSTDDLSARTVYPDIIVHKRGPDGPNLLVIEAKKDANARSEANDKEKLRMIQREYGYLFSVFVNFKTEAKEICFEFL